VGSAALSKEGAHVYITGRREQELATALTQIGGEATGVRGEAPMTAEHVLRLHIDGFNRALQQRDYAALEAIYSERYMLVRSDGSVLNKEQVLRDLREQGLMFPRIDIEDLLIRVFGSTAILTPRAKQHRRATGRAQMRTSGSLRCMLKRVT
jgi:hypothetical protein